MKHTKIQLIYYFIIIFTAIVFSINSFAVTKTWNGSPDVWDDSSSWSPAGAPTSSDDAIVTAGQAVVLNVDGECKSLDVSGSGFVIVNHADRKLTVSDDAIVSDSGAQLRANLGLFDVGGTATATNSGKIVIDSTNATFKANNLVLDTGTLEWNSGTLWLTDDIYIKTGSPLQSRTISENHTLLSSNASSSIALWLQDSGILTLDGGKIICNNFFKTAAATLNFYDGELIVDADGGANFEWGSFPLVLNGSSLDKNPHLTFDGFYLPDAYADVLVATGVNSRASLTITDYTRMCGNATVAGGQGSIADVIVSDTGEWQPTNLVVGSYGSASLTITNNSRLDQCRDFYIGRHAGSTGIVTITKNSSWDSYWKTYVAERGLAIISIFDNSYMKLGAQSQDAIFGKDSGSEARVTISDPGSKLEILTTGNPIYIFGESGSASLVISNGASASFDNFTEFGVHASGRGNVVVTGNGSKFHISDDVWFGYEGKSTMQVLDGATCLWSETKLGEFPNGVGEVVVSGAGSYWNGGGYSSIGGEFLVARYGHGTVLVENGATLHSSGYSEIAKRDESSGSVTITGAGSLWHANHSLEIGNTYFTHATGIVTIANGGRVIVNSGVTIGYNSVLMGNGGTLHAAVDNINGQINPGSSVGILTIDGNLSQQTGGTINIELAGTTLNEHDLLVVTGTTTIAGTLIVTAIDGHTPTNGLTYQIFEWVGGTSGSFDDVQLPALTVGLEWSTNQLYTTGILHVIPEPGILWIFGLLELWIIGRRKLIPRH